MGDYQQQLFHVGIRVPDLEAAMEDVGRTLGLTWATVVERDQQVWTPSGGVATTPLRFTYSTEGPQHVELLQGASGSVWDGHDLPGLHHVGVWADDVAAETERLLAAGWSLEAAERPPEEGYGAMSYLRSPSGLRLEPVSSRFKSKFERWWAGAALA